MLFALYNTLCERIPETEGSQFGLPISGLDDLWLCVDFKAYPTLLLPAKETDLRPDIVLRSVDVGFSRQCEIQTADNQAQSGCYTIIRLKDDDPDIVRLFMRILEERFCGGDDAFNNAAIAESIQEIAALFSQVGGASRDLIGLWGELFAIAQSVDAEAAIRSWSARKNAKFDFITESFVLDVKTTLSNIPKHRFSMEQLRPAGDYDAFIFSLCVEEVPAGKSVGEMMDMVTDRITDTELRSAFLLQCLVKGGRDIYQSQLRLQAYPEENSYAVFDARDIPVPVVELGSPIDNIRFDVELTQIEPTQNRANALASVSYDASIDFDYFRR